MQVGRTKTVAPVDGVGKPQFVQEGAHTAEEEAEALEVLVVEMPGASTKLQEKLEAKEAVAHPLIILCISGLS